MKKQTDCDGCEFPENFRSHSCGITCCQETVNREKIKILNEIYKYKDQKTAKEILDATVDFLKS